MRRAMLLIGLLATAGAAGTTTWIEQRRNGPSSLPTESPAAAVDPLHAKHQVGRYLIKASAPTVIRVPITNHLAEAVRFEALDCGCVCRTAAFAKADLAPGEQGEMRISISSASSGQPTVFVCNWKDNAGRTWSSECRAELIPEESFETRHCQHLGLRPRATFRDDVRFIQHSEAGAPLPPPPVFALSNKQVRIVSTNTATEVVDGGWTRRTVTVRVEGDAGDQPGYHATQLYADRPVPGVTLEWQVKQLVQVSPVNLVLTRQDFANTQVVRQSFLLRSTEGPFQSVSAEVSGLPDGLVRVSVHGQSGVTIRVDVESRWAGETRNGRIVIRTGMADYPRVEIPVSFIAE